MDVINVKDLELKIPSINPLKREKVVLQRPRYELFIRGPIDFEWVKKAATLPGKTWLVGTAIWFVVGMAESNTITIQGWIIADLNISRKAFNRALGRLEGIGLISVNRRPGCSPEITLLPTPQEDHEQEKPTENRYWRRSSRPGSRSPRKNRDSSYIQLTKTAKII